MEKLLHVHAERWKRRSRRTLNMLRTSRKTYYDQKFGAASCFGVGSDIFMKDFTRKKRKGGKLDLIAMAWAVHRHCSTW